MGSPAATTPATATGTTPKEAETSEQAPESAVSPAADATSPAAEGNPGSAVASPVQEGGHSAKGSPCGESSLAAVDAGAAELNVDGSVTGALTSESPAKTPGSAAVAPPMLPIPQAEAPVRKSKETCC